MLKHKRFAQCLEMAQKIVAAYRAQAPAGFDPLNALPEPTDITIPDNVIVPSIFTPYAIERTAELSAFWQSGVVDTDPQFAALATGAGKTIDMPFWQDLGSGGSSQIVSASTPATTKKIVASQDVATIHERQDAWSDNDLAGIYAGSDPATTVGDLVAAYWMRDMQHMLLSSLIGVFDSASLSGLNQLDNYLPSGSTFTDANFLNGRTFIDGKQTLGDAAGKLQAIGMHSEVESSLRKNDLIDFIPDSEGKLTIAVFQGLRVIVDDGLTVATINSANVYSTYLFGLGAFAYGVGRKDIPIKARPGSTWEVEFDRISLAGVNTFINRRRFILHPRGVKYNGAVQTAESPTNTELEDGDNWTLVYEPKNFRVARIRHNIDQT